MGYIQSSSLTYSPYYKDTSTHTKVCCEICPITEGDRTRSRTPHRDIGATKNDTDQCCAAKGIPAHHSGYVGVMRTLFAEINSITDNVATPTYTNPDDMIQALQGLHISELLEFEDDDADEDGPNDFEAPLRAIQSDTKDYTMGSSEKLQASLGALIEEYSDIFSYSVKGRSMDVPQWNLLSTWRYGKRTPIERHSAR